MYWPWNTLHVTTGPLLEPNLQFSVPGCAAWCLVLVQLAVQGGTKGVVHLSAAAAPCLREHCTFTFMRKTPCCVREKTGFCFKILQCALCRWVLSFPPYPLISSLVIVYLRFEMGEIKFGNSFHSILMNSIRKQKAFVVSSKWVFWSHFPATEVSKVS